MPSLQLHMYRVAACGFLLCDRFQPSLNKDLVVTSCLLHDIGNIVKFRLDLYPQFLEPEGLEYWLEIQQQFVDAYGKDEYKATIRILKELNISCDVVNVIDAIGFKKAPKNFEHDDFAKKICCYVDQRVTPYGVRSLEERIYEGKRRYQLNKSVDQNEEEFEYYAQYLRKIEDQIFEKCNVCADCLNDKYVNPLIRFLESYDIKARLE